MTTSEDHPPQQVLPGDPATPPAPPSQPRDAGELLSRLELINAQPLAERASGFEQLHDELLADLQRSDHHANQ